MANNCYLHALLSSDERGRASWGNDCSNANFSQCTGAPIKEICIASCMPFSLSGLGTWVLMAGGYRAFFFYYCSAVIRGKIVTPERLYLYAFRVLPAGLATLSWQRLCHWCRGTQWRTLRPLLTNDRMCRRLLVPCYLQVRSKLTLVCIGDSDDGYLIGA